MTANNVPCRLCSFLEEWGHAASLNVMPTARVSARLHGGRVLRHWTSAPDASCLQQQYFLSALGKTRFNRNPMCRLLTILETQRRARLYGHCAKTSLSNSDFVETFADKSIYIKSSRERVTFPPTPNSCKNPAVTAYLIDASVVNFPPVVA